VTEADFVGPPRPSASLRDDETIEEDERKLRAIEWERVKENNKAKVIKRDEWMTELPPENRLGATLTNRQFQKNEKKGRGDTSIWTDSPADREKKKQKVTETIKTNLEEVAQQEFALAKEEKNAKIMEQYNKKFRGKSLADEHQEILKKKQENEKPEEEPLWKPFDRDTDLGRRTADPKTTAKLIKNANDLNTRFGASSGTRFL